MEHETALAFRQPLYNRVEKREVIVCDIDAGLHFGTPFNVVRRIEVALKLFAAIKHLHLPQLPGDDRAVHRYFLLQVSTFGSYDAGRRIGGHIQVDAPIHGPARMSRQQFRKLQRPITPLA